MTTRLATSLGSRLSSLSTRVGGRPSSLVLQHRFMSVINLSDLDATATFRQVNKKSILYFTATWCPPCKAIKPLYEKMAKEYPDVAFGKVDIDDNGDAATEHNISAVPTFIFFDGEDVIERFSGADSQTLESLVKNLDSK
jgi:thioredoxin 1